ncbi:MAG: DMT family transporter [Leptolyngbyaceae cyanobacterium SM2_3_12]|nr:DMT family transporter [Leptolyngbyaceae cyanobacterium SM2_3_12]
MSYAVILILAILGGIAIVVQGQFMGLLAQNLGPLESIFITYLGGFLLAAIALLIHQGGNLKAWPTMPWYTLTSGFLGLVIIGVIGYVVPRLGLATGFTVIVAAQFICSVIIDHYGFLGVMVRPFDVPRLLGLGLVMAGVTLMVR